MEDNTLNMNKLCYLLNFDCIKEEIDNILEGYQLFDNDIDEADKKYLYSYCTDDERCRIDLMLDNKSVWLKKQTGNSVEIITVAKDLEWLNKTRRRITFSHKTLEKRENGIVYTNVLKQFENSTRHSDKEVLVDLFERRYVFTMNDLESLVAEDLLNNIFYTMQQVIEILVPLEANDLLKENCSYYSEFSTHMNYYYPFGKRYATDNPCSTETYLNGEDISGIYDIVEGDDKLYRVYDLYKGVINSRNKDDIFAIHMGFLSQDAFDLKTLKGITEQEDNLIGKSLENISGNYFNYIKQLLHDQYGYDSPLELTRESILNAIMYNTSIPAPVEKQVEVINGNNHVTNNPLKKVLRKIFRGPNKK